MGSGLWAIAFVLAAHPAVEISDRGAITILFVTFCLLVSEVTSYIKKF